MLILQKTFKYEGDAKLCPVNYVKLAFTCPVFSYKNTGLKTIQREIASQKTYSLTQDLNRNEYHIEIPVENIVGGEYFDLFCKYSADHWEDIDNLAIGIPTEIVVGNLQLGSQTLEAIYYSPLFVLPVSESGLKTFPTNLKKSIFLLNKKTFIRLSEQFTKEIGAINNQTLLLLIALIKMNYETGEATSDKWISGMLVESKIQGEVKDIKEYIAKYLSQLFDFPISVPEIKPQELAIAGTLRIKTPDGRKLPDEELGRYAVGVEYLGHSAPSSYATVAGTSENLRQFASGAKFLIPGDNINEVSIIVRAYGVVLMARQYQADDSILKSLDLEVNAYLPLEIGDSSSSIEETKKLRGRVVELTDKCCLENISVIIRAKKTDDTSWQPVAFASTDKSGNFSMAYPFGIFTAAQAIVSLTPDSPIDIPIVKTQNINQTISDNFLYLLIQSGECAEEENKEDDCSCHSLKKASRLPDQADLINSDEYTQDIGGACVNLSTPNRTISEYSYKAIVRTSDPDVSNYTLQKKEKMNFGYGTEKTSRANLSHFELSPGGSTISRKRIDLENPIKWQDAKGSGEDLTLYQSVNVATGHILYYKAEFKSDGYSLGNLLYSLPLAPGQKKQIVVFDSVHTLQGSESQKISQGERLAANLVNERAITDQLSGNLRESIEASSSTNTWGVSAGLGAAAQYGGMGAALGVAGGYASASSSASQNSSRDVSQFFGEKLRQAIMQNAESYRQLNTSVVTTVQEGQRYSATTEVVANHNHCHALTMMYFEVLRHYAIYQELTGVEECVFVPLLMTNFTPENIYKWSDVLAKNLLPLHSNTYLSQSRLVFFAPPHPLLKAFDAVQRIKTNYETVDYPTGAYCDESITSVSGRLNVRVNIPRPKTKFDRILSFPILKRELMGIGMIGDMFPYLEEAQRQKILSEDIVVYDNFQQARPADVIEVIIFDNFLLTGTPDERLWKAIADLCGYKDNVQGFLRNYFSNKTVSQWDIVFNEEIAPKLFSVLTEEIMIPSFGKMDFTTMSKYKGGEQSIPILFRGNRYSTRKDIPNVKVDFRDPVNSSYRTDFWSHVTFILEDLSIDYTTRHFQQKIIDKYIGDDLSDGIELIPTPMNSEELKDPRKEDQYLANKLIEHLNSNIEHYNKALWLNLGPDRRYMMLDAFSIDIFDEFGDSVSATRSLASIVKNEVITVVGNSLVMPVAAGYKVSQSYIVAKTSKGDQKHVTLLDHYKPVTPVQPYRISVPSRGVFLEAVQGACDACEKIKENSSQDWTKFTTDEPTAFNPVTTPVPTITNWKANYKDFATPMVNIQNAPATPSPGAGLAGLSELLGKTGIFRDLSGLDANQQNVIRTYLSNQENAKAFAEMAKSMVMQGHNTQNSDKIMDNLKTAKDSGAINQDEYSKLVKGHLQQQIDGGEISKAEIENQKAIKPTLSDAAVNAVAQGREVEASKTDDEGNIETIKISADDRTQSLDEVDSKLQNIPPAIIPSAKYPLKDVGRQAYSLNWSTDKAKDWEINPILLSRKDNYDSLTLLEIYRKHVDNRITISCENEVKDIKALKVKQSEAQFSSQRLLAQIEWQTKVYAAIDTLNPENLIDYTKTDGQLTRNKTTNKRYWPTTGDTFCNIYAHDIVWALGGYLPRVFWTDSKAIIDRLRKGENIEPQHGVNVWEQSANSLSNWFNKYGAEFGWKNTKDPAEAQKKANYGCIVITVASSTAGTGHGHINLVVPEEIRYKSISAANLKSAKTNDSGSIIVPLSSQAGRSNFNYSDEHYGDNSFGTANNQWWLGAEMRKEANGNFWYLENKKTTDLELPGYIMPPFNFPQDLHPDIYIAPL